LSGIALTIDGATVSRQAADDLAADVEQAMGSLGIPEGAEASLVLSTDAELQRLNHAYRGIDKPTDVLSFPFDGENVPPEEASEYLGDILISVEFACRSADQAGRPLEAELRLLAVHGLLHLLGHEDETDAGAERMRQVETSLGVREAP
jgi:probable rRNA maturation factor